ncbi:MAG TPA: manganese efflux pump [Clostridia bacterium]|jgi:putative Mn2+ efflux pump MntP|nr:manganese efflux pump [Clostridia bacterium]
MLTVLSLAVALGTDAFSLAIGVGMKGVGLRDNLKISGVIGLMHIIMPLIGYYLGSIAGKILGDVAGYLGGAILIFLGTMMLKDSQREKEEKEFQFDHNSGLGLMALALGVSLDALSVGFSLGTIGLNLWLTLIALGVVSAVMTSGGILLGDKVGSFLGKRAEVLGAAILIVLGAKIIYDLFVA